MGTKVADRIARLIEEHDSIRHALTSLDAYTSDLEPTSQLKDFAKKIDSERLAVGPWPLHLGEDVSAIEIRLSTHFSNEEGVLAECCEIFDDKGLADALDWLRTAHREIMGRMDDLRSKVKQIPAALASQGDWVALAFMARERLIDTRLLLEKHAEEEELLFKMLRDRLDARNS